MPVFAIDSTLATNSHLLADAMVVFGLDADLTSDSTFSADLTVQYALDAAPTGMSMMSGDLAPHMVDADLVANSIFGPVALTVHRPLTASLASNSNFTVSTPVITHSNAPPTPSRVKPPSLRMTPQPPPTLHPIINPPSTNTLPGGVNVKK